jgi:putative oxidoreductase
MGNTHCLTGLDSGGGPKRDAGFISDKSRSVKESSMYPAVQDAAGKLLLRVSVAALIMMHGISKLSRGVAGIASQLEAAGFPGFIAYGAYIGEIVAPLMMIVGFYARLGAAVVAFNMIVAILLVHSHHLFTLTPNGGFEIELQYIYLLGALSVMLMGAGRYAINDR